MEKIYSNPESDEVPIGTRIFASVVGDRSKPNSGEKLSLPFHVFIPNYAVADSEWQSGDPDYDLDYFKNLKAKYSDFERLCPVQVDSINKSLRR